jgi:hypothetical protein
MICEYLQIKSDVFLYNRPNGELTIVNYHDPIQLMIPTPKKSRAIEGLTKERSTEILEWLVHATADMVKDNQEIIVANLTRTQLQPIYHFLLEDWLKYEHQYDFEDFKATLMNNGALCDDNYYLASMIEEVDEEVHTHFVDKFVDSE